MSLYRFRRLVQKYSKEDVIVYPKVIGTKIDMSKGGQVVEEVENVKVNGAIIANKSNIHIDSGGVGTVDELLFYTYDYIEDNGKIILENGDKYTCTLSKDYSKFDTYKDGLRIYKLESGHNG